LACGSSSLTSSLRRSRWARKAKTAGLRAELLKPLVGYLISAGLILVSAPALARSANQLAELTGLGNTFFGTVFLPLCTTLPELVAGLTALRMAAFPLIIGNASGSIAFNLLLLVPIDLAYDGSLMAVASQAHVVTCFAAILATAIAVMGSFTTPSGGLVLSSRTRC
jgi:cation:H+ antiporter